MQNNWYNSTLPRPHGAQHWQQRHLICASAEHQAAPGLTRHFQGEHKDKHNCARGRWVWTAPDMPAGSQDNHSFFFHGRRNVDISTGGCSVRLVTLVIGLWRSGQLTRLCYILITYRWWYISWPRRFDSYIPDQPRPSNFNRISQTNHQWRKNRVWHPQSCFHIMGCIRPLYVNDFLKKKFSGCSTFMLLMIEW